MTHEELTTARRSLGLKRTEMAKVLRTPYRTYQDWELGKTRIPGLLETAMELLVMKDQLFFNQLRERFSATYDDERKI